MHYSCQKSNLLLFICLYFNRWAMNPIFRINQIAVLRYENQQQENATPILDEIGDLSIDVQVSLLRLFEEGVFERLGSAKACQMDLTIKWAGKKPARS
jgi:hypothetical protein